LPFSCFPDNLKDLERQVNVHALTFHTHTHLLTALYMHPNSNTHLLLGQRLTVAIKHSTVLFVSFSYIANNVATKMANWCKNA